MLQQVGETLEEEGIKHVFVKGNVHSKTNAIATFKKSSEVRCIMLSLESAASGLNLTEANYVVLIDPVAGTREQGWNFNLLEFYY